MEWQWVSFLLGTITTALGVVIGYVIGVKMANDAWREETNRVLREAVKSLEPEPKPNLPICKKCGHSNMHHRPQLSGAGIPYEACHIEGCDCTLTWREVIDGSAWA